MFRKVPLEDAFFEGESLDSGLSSWPHVDCRVLQTHIGGTVDCQQKIVIIQFADFGNLRVKRPTTLIHLSETAYDFHLHTVWIGY